LHATESEKLAGHADGAIRGLLNLLDASLVEGVRALAVGKKVAVAANHGEQVVEIVRHTTGEASDGFHFVSLAQPVFETFLLALRVLQTGAHAIECAGDFANFVSTRGLQRVIVIPFFEGAHAGHQDGKRLREVMRNQKNESAAGEYAEEAECDERVIQAAEKCRGLIKRFKNADGDGTFAGKRKIQGVHEVAFGTEMQFLRTVGLRREFVAGGYKILLIGQRKGAGDYCVTRAKNDLAGDGGGKFLCGFFIDFMADGHDAGGGFLSGGSEIDRLEPDLVQMTTAEPPIAILIFVNGDRKSGLGNLRGERFGIGLQTDDGTVAVGENEKVTLAELVDAGGFVLNGCGVLGGHKGADVWQIGEQLRRAALTGFPLGFEDAIGFDGILQFLTKGFTDALFHAVADEQKSCRGKSRRDGQEREQEFGAQSGLSEQASLPGEIVGLRAEDFLRAGGNQ
jgi:hypothetical protein